jgi:hypothetical protein
MKQRGSENMKTLKTGIVLLALLLVAMEPMVSAMQNDLNAVSGNQNSITPQEKTIENAIALGSSSSDIIENNYVPLAIARNQAIEELNEVIYLKKFGDGVNWTGSTLNQTPIIVYDTNGKMLYYKFWVLSEGKICGEINIASSSVLGSPVQSVSTDSSEGLNVDKMEARANDIISTSFIGYSIKSENVVLYDYPSTGLLFELLNKKNETVKFVLDQNNYPDYRIIGSSNSTPIMKNIMFNNNSRSQYDSISQNDKKTNINIWKNENQRIESINGKINQIISPAPGSGTNLVQSTLAKDKAVTSALMTGKALAGSRVLLRNGLFPTVFQGYGYDWCKVGTAQTITTYYYLIGRPMDNGQSLPRTRTLQEIATKMGAQGTSAPTSPWLEQYYYQDPWTSGGLGMKQFLYEPYAPTLAYIEGQINNGDPMKIGTQKAISTPFGIVPAGHARACYGYDTTGSQPMVYFSDSRLNPYQGELTYEVFSSSNYNTYIGKS